MIIYLIIYFELYWDNNFLCVSRFVLSDRRLSLTSLKLIQKNQIDVSADFPASSRPARLAATATEINLVQSAAWMAERISPRVTQAARIIRSPTARWHR